MRTSAANVAALATLFAVACGQGEKVPVDSALVPLPLLPEPPAPAPPRPVAGRYTIADFSRLRWLEGRWRGFMPNGDTFYEQYRFVNDSTIAMYGFGDSTFTKATDSARVQLRGGTVSNESLTARWVVTRLDSTGIDFAPERGASNYFTWAQEAPTRWNATLR